MKNYNRKSPTFANINLLGKCNINCYFCLGKDLPEYFNKKDYNTVHYSEWKNLDKFILLCQQNNIKKIYLTGQNTDPLMYMHLKELIDFLQSMKFYVGIRTNGYGAIGHLDTINSCKEEIGYTINSLDYNINHKITGIYEIPDWKYIIPRTNWCRVSIVVNRYNFIDILNMIKYISKFDNVNYIQLRRISTDKRIDELQIDQDIFEKVYQSFKSNFNNLFVQDFYNAEVLYLWNKQITFWRTTATTINSFNYYVDGTVSDEYFIIEGYLKNKDN